MDARRSTLAVALLALLSLGASYRTPNFVVNAPTQQIAEQVGQAAEDYRRELAIQWLGAAMPQWSQPCPIFVRVAPNLGAGGATSFNFDRGEVFGWKMTIQGSLERILDSVLPHEVTHTVFASHFRQPLPRWADEGACTTVEHPSERANHQRMLVEFLRTGRGISFSHMYRMKEYPRDVLPLYAQGHSLASFLIAQGGKRKFLRYIGDGLQNEAWSQVTREHYGFADLRELQESWLEWVRRGSPPLGTPETESRPGALVAAATGGGKRPRPRPNLLYRDKRQGREIFPFGKLVPVQPTSSKTAEDLAEREARPAATVRDEGWHRPGQRPRRSASPVAASERRDEADGGTAVQVTRPQRAQPAHEIILEWSRDSQEQPPARPPVRYDATPGRMLR